MLKKQLTKEEMSTIARDLDHTSFMAVDDLINNLHIEQHKETAVYLITTNRRVAETILADEYDTPTSLNQDYVARILVQYGDDNYAVTTEYGEMFVDKEGFVKYMKSAKESLIVSLSVKNDLMKNLKFTIVYTPEYSCIDTDSWRCDLLSADRLVIALDANHILYTGEKDFISSQVLPCYSAAGRLLFAIGDAQQIKSAEWPDAISRVKILLGDTFEAVPFFTEEISEERKLRYAGYECTLQNILQDAQRHALDLRMLHCQEVENYKAALLEQSLVKLKDKMEKALAAGRQGLASAQLNESVVADSKKHIEDNVDLFLQYPLMMKMRNATDEFATLLNRSLAEDIDASQDIKQDARSLTRYLSAVWTQFTDDQNQTVYGEFEKEAKMLLEMMDLDLRNITHSIQSLDAQGAIKKKIASSFGVNTFFSRKTTSGNSTTDALTIGGVLAGIFVTPLGWVAVAASEIVKIVGKDSMNEEYKRTLKSKVAEIIDKNKADILGKAEMRFKQVSADFKTEIMKYYDEILSSVNQIVKDEEEKASKASETIETINSLII